MRKVSALAIAAVALLGAESATAQLPSPSVPKPPPVPTVTAPTLLDPVLEAAPTVPRPPAVPPVTTAPRPPAPNAPLPQVPRLPGARPNVGGGANTPVVPGRRPTPSQGGRTPGGSAPAGGPSSGGSGTPSTGGSGATSTGGTAGGARRPARSGRPASRTRTTVRRARRERRLRTTVRRLQGCFGALSDLERRVLVLRAGIGSGPPRTRSQVARRLDVSTRRVTGLERRGVRTLRGASGAGRCGAGGGGESTTAAAVEGPRLAAGLQGLRGLIGPGPSTDRTEVKGERKSSGGGEPSESESAATLEQRVTALPRARVLGADLTIPLLVALGLAGIWFMIRLVRRTLGSTPLS